MVALEDAVAQILDQVGQLPAGMVRIHEAAARYTHAPISATHDLPLFDNSAMDGYAVRSEDIAKATPEKPVPLCVVGHVPAGEVMSSAITPGTCARIFTGSALPAGADAVVMQEDTERDAVRENVVLVKDKVRPFENVRLRGEEVKAGTEIVPAGAKLTAGRIGLLGAMGIREIAVSRSPVVALIATGSELIDVEAERADRGFTPAATGRIYESNRLMLATALRGAGGIPKIFPLVPDTPAATRDALAKAFAETDAVVTSGGVSVGEHDVVKAAFEELGGRISYWRIAVKPGKPFVFGRLGEKLFFGLPGNPVSAFVTFMLLVRPALLRWQGAADVRLASHPAVLGERLINRAERRHFMCVRVNGKGEVFSSGLQASHAIVGLANADGLVDVPPKTTFESGSTVQVLRWDL